MLLKSKFRMILGKRSYLNVTYHFGKSVQQRHHKFEKKSGALRGYLKEAAGGQKGVEKEGVFLPFTSASYYVKWRT